MKKVAIIILIISMFSTLLYTTSAISLHSPYIVTLPNGNKIEYEYYCDANEDGIFNIKDITYLQKLLAGIIDIDATEIFVDSNNDNYFDIKDVSILQKALNSPVSITEETSTPNGEWLPPYFD